MSYTGSQSLDYAAGNLSFETQISNSSLYYLVQQHVHPATELTEYYEG